MSEAIFNSKLNEDKATVSLTPAHWRKWKEYVSADKMNACINIHWREW